MAGTNTNNKIVTTVELDVSQVQRQIVKLNGSASDTTKKLEDRIKDKNKAVELQNKLSKKVLAALKKENDSLKKAGASTKEITASTKKLNAEKLRSAKASAANTKQLNKLNASSKKSSKGLGFLSKGMGGAASGANLLKVAVVAAAAAFVLVVKKGAEFAKALSSLEAVSGATSKEMKEMSRQAKELGASTAFTASEVVSLQTELAKLGNSAEDIQKSTPSILNLAASLEIGLADAASFAGSTVNAFGLEASDTQRIVDVMAESAASSAQDFGTLRESFVQAAPAASALGVSVERTSALLGVLADSGIKGGAAGTALKNAFIELKKEGLTLEEGLAKISNSSDKLGTAIELAGKRGGPALLILAKNGDGIERLENKLNGAAGAAQRMADIKLNNLSGDVTKLQSAFEGFVLGLFSGTGALNDFLRTLVQGASSVLNFFTSTESVTEAMEEQRVSLFGVKAELARYDKIIKDVASSEDEVNAATLSRLSLIKKLQKEYPDYLSNIDAEKISTDELNGAIGKVNASLINKIILQEEDEKLADQNKETADALRDSLEDQAKSQNEANKALAEYGALGDGIQATDPAGVLRELIKLQEEQTEVRKTGSKLGLINNKQNIELNTQIRILKDSLTEATDSEADYNEELGKSNEALETRRKLANSLGLGEKVETPEEKKSREEKEAAAIEAEEQEKIDEAKRIARAEAKVKRDAAAKKQKAKDDAEEVIRKAKVVKLKEDLVKKEEDAQANTDILKVELDRKRHIAKLEALGLEKDEEFEQRVKLDKIYDDKLKVIKAEKDAETQIENAEKQFELDELEIQRKKDLGERTLELELQLLIRKRDQELLIAGDDAKKKLIIEKKYSNAKDSFQKIAADAEQKRKDDLLNAGIAAAGEAFGIGKELSIATALVNTYKGISEVWSAKSESGLVGAGFAQKIATSAITAVQGFNTVKQIMNTKGPSGGGKRGGGGPGPAPAPVSAPAPVGISNVSDVAGSNASRLGTDSSLSSRASSDAANGAQLSGNSSRVVFSENAYSDFQSQVQFREDRTTISG